MGKKRGKTGRESCPLSCVRHRACWCSDSVQTLRVWLQNPALPVVEVTGGMEGPEPRCGTVEYRAIRCGTGTDHVPTCMYSTEFLVQHPPRPGPSQTQRPRLDPMQNAQHLAVFPSIVTALGSPTQSDIDRMPPSPRTDRADPAATMILLSPERNALRAARWPGSTTS